MARRPSSRTILSPASRRWVAGLLIAAGVLLIIGELLRVYVLVIEWQHYGAWGPVAGVLLGLGTGTLTSYIGWRVGVGG